MASKKSTTYSTLIHWKSFREKIIIKAIIIGFFTGITVIFFSYLLKETEFLIETVYTSLKKGNTVTIIIWFASLIFIGYILGLIIKKEPMISGSGIPQVKGIFLGQIKCDWLKTLIFKFLGGIIALGAGLSLGREGPSVQLGTAVGQGLSKLFTRFKTEEKYLITCGASAGLAAAFNAPLAGLVFALEELHKNLSPSVIVSATVASITADLVTQKLRGPIHIFSLGQLQIVPPDYYIYLVLLGTVTGLLGKVFNVTLIKTQDLYNRLECIKAEFKPAIPLIIAGILGIYLPEVLGGGHELIDSLNRTKFALNYLLILLIVKFLFTMVSYGSGVPGGIFLPLLAIGALIGDIFGTLSVRIFHLNPVYTQNFIVLAMAGYFSAIVKAPITGSILITEMTGSFEHLLALITVSVTSYLITDISKNKPIYDTLLERLLIKKDSETLPICDKEKIIMEIPVSVGSVFDGKRVKDIKWPSHCLLVGISRSATEVIPKGNTVIYPGDYLVVLADEDKATEINRILSQMAQEFTGS